MWWLLLFGSIYIHTHFILLNCKCINHLNLIAHMHVSCSLFSHFTCVFMMRNIKIIMCMSLHAVAAAFFMNEDFFFTFLMWNWHLTSSSISYDDVAMDVFMFMHKTGCTHYRGHINDMREMCKQPAIARWLYSQSIIKYTTKGMELRTTATIL